MNTGPVTLASQQKNRASSKKPSSKSQLLIDLITDQLESQAENIILSKAGARDMIQQLMSSEGSIACEDHHRELAEFREREQKFQAHVRLGDYAGKLFNDLKSSWVDVDNKGTPQLATSLSKELQDEEQGHIIGGRTLSVKRSVGTWTSTNFSEDENVEMVKLAIDAYGARNDVCHSKAAQLKAASEWDDLGKEISKDLEELESVLPADQVEHLSTWHRMIKYYRDGYGGCKDFRCQPPYISYDSNCGRWVPPEDEFEKTNAVTSQFEKTNAVTSQFDNYEHWDSGRMPRYVKACPDAVRSDPPLIPEERQRKDRDSKPFEILTMPRSLRKLRILAVAEGPLDDRPVDEEYDRLVGSLVINLKAGRNKNLNEAKSLIEGFIEKSGQVLKGHSASQVRKTHKQLAKEKRELRRSYNLEGKKQRQSIMDKSMIEVWKERASKREEEKGKGKEKESKVEEGKETVQVRDKDSKSSL